ncbi:MAG: geopeptide radical SAM maturase [Nitrospiraceae bacterium]|nr:geopeptide radical SAM maturase [Nitrospiraceae bacterium]
MQLSRYCKAYPDPGDPQGLILFSTKNAAIIRIPKSSLGNISRLEGDRKLLKNWGFLIEDPGKEKIDMLGFIDELNRLNRTLSIKLVMCLDCNLACRYCFEGTRKGRHYMTKETADDFVEFVRKRIASRPKIKELQVTFYGGEPLMSKQLILRISSRLKRLARSPGIPFSFYLITNGTLLTKETVKEMKRLGLKEAYVSIDGPQDNHDITRPYKSGRGSFGRIICNIHDVCGMIEVQTGGNFTKENYKRFPELLGYLTAEGLLPSKVAVRGFFPVTAESADFALPDFHEGIASIDEPWLFDASVYLREEILKRGCRLEPVGPGVCMMEHRNNILVNYDGSICKCPGLIGRKEYVIGDIWSGTGDYRASHNLDNWKNDECLDCAYLPLCFGGCRYMKLVRDGNMDGVDCRKAYFDATLEAFVNQDMKYGLVRK